jgi:hypothetical protein
MLDLSLGLFIFFNSTLLSSLFLSDFTLLNIFIVLFLIKLVKSNKNDDDSFIFKSLFVKSVLSLFKCSAKTSLLIESLSSFLILSDEILLVSASLGLDFIDIVSCSINLKL